MKGALWFFLSLLIVLMGIPPSWAQKMEPREIMGQSLLAQFYPGGDFRAKVTMRLINKEGAERVREMTMLRRNSKEGGEQKYFLYFHKPSDVRGTAFLVWKYPQKDDDRWLFIPALNFVRRVAQSDKRSSFVGSDFSYEDISGRDLDDDEHRFLKEERLDGKETYVIESIPKDKGSSDYSRKLSWIDKLTFLPLKEEYYDKRGEPYRTFSADEVKQVDRFWTITKRTMKNLQTGHRTEVTSQDVGYKVGLTEDIFTERYLRNPPARWIR